MNRSLALHLTLWIQAAALLLTCERVLEAHGEHGIDRVYWQLHRSMMDQQHRLDDYRRFVAAGVL